MFNHGQNHKVKYTLSIANQFGCKDTIFLRNMQGVMVLSEATAPKYTSRLYIPLLSVNRVNRP